MKSLNFSTIFTNLSCKHGNKATFSCLIRFTPLSRMTKSMACVHSKFPTKVTLVDSIQTRFYSERKVNGRPKLLEGSEKSTIRSLEERDKFAQLFSKQHSHEQFNMIEKFMEEETTLPSYEKWEDLRENVLSVKGGKLRGDNVDSVILSKCIPYLEKSKSFIKFLNQKYKKVNSQQMGMLFKSFYLNKDKCTPEDLVFIKKMFRPFIQDKKTAMAHAITHSLMAGISITDEWKQGVLLLEASGTENTDHNCLVPLIEAAISHDDINFAMKYLQKLLSLTKSVPEELVNYWIRHIKSSHQMDEFLQFLNESSLIITKTSADLLYTQCFSHPQTAYTCTYTNIHGRFNQCCHCKQTLDPLVLSPGEFEQLKKIFLNRTLVGQDIFEKTTPHELQKFLHFLDHCQPYDIVLDSLNVAHLGGVHNQPFTLRKVVSYYLEQGANLLLLGRKHMLRWPKDIVQPLYEKCQVFYVDNLSQDDPYLLYATMHCGPQTQFISRDLMRSHIFLLKDQSLRSTFLKWQQLNQIIILSVNGPRPIIRQPPTYVQHAHSSSHQGRKQWHVPYKEDVEELTFDQVYNPKPTWLCLRNTRKKR